MSIPDNVEQTEAQRFTTDDLDNFYEYDIASWSSHFNGYSVRILEVDAEVYVVKAYNPFTGTNVTMHTKWVVAIDQANAWLSKFEKDYKKRKETW